MAPKPACPGCGSKRKWRKQAGTGTLACSCGRVLEGYRNETIEAGDFGPHAMRKRDIKSTRAAVGKKSGANPILYHGDRARFHYFQCLQVLLRMQIAKLTELWKLPPDFEIICRDTWALHLGLLSDPPPPEPLFHAEEQEELQKPDFAQKAKSSQSIKETKKDRNTGEAKNVLGSSDTGSSSEPDDEGGSDDEASSKMDELVREMEAEHSESDEEDRGSQKIKGVSQSKRGMRWPGDDDSPAATICVLVHSCWLMRIPVIYKDFISLVETYTLPYLDPIRLFPESLTRHLTKQAKQALSPHRAPTPILLHTITSRLARRCFELYGIFTPELNTAQVLWRTVRHMGGPPALYQISKALAQYLELPLTINPVMAPPLVKRSRKDPLSHKGDNIPPELALVAVVVIALKLIYRFDGRQVSPTEDWDPAHTMPAVEVYIDHLRSLDTSEIESNRRYFFRATSADMAVQDEDELDLDAYLTFFCERALLAGPDRDSKAGNDDIAQEFFPLQRGRRMEVVDKGGGSSQFDRLGKLGIRNDDDELPFLRTARVVDELKADEANKGGGSYGMYSGQDGFGVVPEKYAIMLSRAVGYCGVSENDLNAILERFERRFVRRWKESIRDRDEENKTE